jgi:hypothetical protein
MLTWPFIVMQVVERGVHTTPGGHIIEANRRIFLAGQFKLSPPYMFESNSFGGGAVVMAQVRTIAILALCARPFGTRKPLRTRSMQNDVSMKSHNSSCSGKALIYSSLLFHVQIQTLDADHDEFLHVRVQSVRTNGFQFCMSGLA